ncbi:MAG TPA: M56 family metallopeptidase, partial [Sedimentisphaerales bacterium]|nr:M56 family metallopeptidase [Sedimentisphaerales bacterium]
MITQLFSQTDVVANCLLHGTICLAAGLIAARLFRRSAARAHEVLLLAMAAAVVVPAMSTLVGRYELGVLTAKAPPPRPSVAESTIMAELAMPIATQLAAGEFQYEPAPPELYSPPAVSTTAQTARTIPWRTILLGLWLVTSVALAARLIVTFVLGKRLLKRASAPSCGTIEQAAETAAEKLAVEKPVVVLVSDKVAGCVIWCWTRRPALLIARSAEARNNNTDWVALFSHELAHLKRLDHVSGLFAELLICIFPWQPLVWVAKKRLIALSEQACDDWAVSTADSHARYARSLLDMVPQSRPAFAPTVVPDGKHLTARIQRILHSGRSNPRIGRGWAMLAIITALSLAVTISFAQTRPAGDRETGIAEQREREGAEERERLQEREHPEAAELRERKMHALELQQRAKEIERRLNGLNADQDEEARKLKTELREIREQMASVMRDFEGVRAPEGDLKARKSDPRFKELMQHHAELQKRAKEIQVELKEHPDHPEKAELLAALEETQKQIRVIERELPGPEPKPRPVGEREMDTHVKELIQHRRELQERAEQIESELRELGDGKPERSQQLREEIGGIVKETEAVERELKGARIVQEPGEPGAPGRKLMQKRAELAERAEMIERKLKEIGDSRPDEAHELKKELDDTLARMREVEAELRAVSDERPRDAGPRNRELMQVRDELARQAEMMERKIKEIGDSRPDEAHQLKKQLDDALGRMRDVEAELRSVREPDQPERERAGDRELRLRELTERRRELEARAR